MSRLTNETTPEHRSRGVTMALASVLIAVVAAGPCPGRAAEPAPSPGHEGSDDAVTLTMSGGVTLGAYEAGLAWGLVRFLALVRSGESGGSRLLHPRLASVTGASAGALNALLAAALWCERPGRGSVDDNILLDAWLDLDLADLLPRELGRYAASDELLAAAPLELASRRLGHALFGPSARERYQPGCRVPVGITVTRFEPRQQDVAGVTTSTQRFVIPWRLEIDADGAATLRRQPMPGEFSESVLDLAGVPGPDEATPFDPAVVEQAVLASGAFPIAFPPRRLCPRLSESAGRPTRAVPDCDEYLDGGVFDNAPLGLALGLAERESGGAVLRPLISFLVDPDLRRLQAAPRAGNEASPDRGTVGRTLRLFRNFLSTARSAELSRAVRSRGWNRTTQKLLRGLADAAEGLAELQATVSRLAPGEATSAGTGDRPETRVVTRAELGRALGACLLQLTASVSRGALAAEPCAAEVTGFQLAPQVAGEAPAPQEVVSLADRLAQLLRTVGDRPAPPGQDQLEQGQAALLSATTLVSTTLLFLADEVGRVAASGLPDASLRRFRDGALAPVLGSVGLARPTALLLDGLLSIELERLAAVAPAPVAAQARRARQRLASLPEGSRFDLDMLQETTAAIWDSLARGSWDTGAVEAAWRGVALVVGTQERFQVLASQLAALHREATDLLGGPGTEYQLSISNRFAPLAGSQLAGFAGFLDQPLRRHDYYAGVYEAVHAIAVATCTFEPPGEGDAVPDRLRGNLSEIDLSTPSSQRCVGRAMRPVVEALGLRSSPQARQMVTTLAGLELAASLGRSSRAQLLRAEPAWAWLDDLAAPAPGDPVLATLAALTAARAPCGPGQDEALCPEERTFDAFLTALAVHGYRPGSASLALALRDPTLWWADILQRLSDRALNLERRSVGARPSSASSAVMTGLSVGELLARRIAGRGPGLRFRFDPSTVPAVSDLPEGRVSWQVATAHALPYRLSLDLTTGGFALAWLEPELWWTTWLSAASVVEPVSFHSGQGGWSSEAGALLMAHTGGLSLGAGPRWWAAWRGGGGLGVEGRVAVLQDRLALGVGTPKLGGRRGGRGWFVTLSVADLNGMAFWLSPLGGAP